MIKKSNEKNKGARSGMIPLAVLIAILAVNACTYDIIPSSPVETPEVVSFSEDIIPYFEISCATSGCHATGAVDPDLSPANAYVSLVPSKYVEEDTARAGESLIYKKVTTGSMAKYSTDQDNALLLKWIQQGAKNN